MSKLDDILFDAMTRHEAQRSAAPITAGEHIKPTKADIKALMLELIGDDEHMEDSQVSAYKDELRQTVNDL